MSEFKNLYQKINEDMKNQYFETLGDVQRHLEEKYSVSFDDGTFKPVGYEQTVTIQQKGVRASIYRMPSGRYEVTDYKVSEKR